MAGALTAGLGAAGGTLATPAGAGAGAGAPKPPAQPTLQNLIPQNPGAVGGTAYDATAGTVGAAPVAKASAAGPQASITNGMINPNDATNAASQLDAITAANSPYIQQARQQGFLSAAQRGLGNSSLSAGATEAAAVQAAAPLAQQNAGEASTTALQNSQLETQAGEFNASQQNANQQLQAQIATQAGQFNAGQKTQASLANAQATNAINAQTQQLTEQLNQQFLSGSQAQQLASIQGQWNSFIQSNASASQLYNTFLSSIGTEMNNKDLDPTRIGTQITDQLNLLQGAMNLMNQIEGGGGAPGTVSGAVNANNPTAAAPPPRPVARPGLHP
jgi:hypothetical protein